MNTRTILIPILVLVVGCDDGNSKDPDTSTDVTADTVVDTSDDTITEVLDVVEEDTVDEPEWVTPELEWTSCSLFEGEDDGRAECATMQMPFRWWDDHDRTFSVTAKRVASSVAPSSQIWLLEGGPGGSGLHGYPEIMEWLASSHPSMQVYTIDARGTGYSQWLECPADETGREASFESSMEELEYCADHLRDTYGDDLSAYGSTQSAHDLWAFIEATRIGDRNVLIWGNSAGTHWAHRFLLLHPDAVDGVVMEAILPPDFFGGFQEKNGEDQILAILDFCAADTDCSTRMPDPHAELTSLLNDLVDGHCPEIGPVGFLSTIGWLIYYRPFNEAIPGMIHRVRRCDAADIEAIETLNAMTFMPGPESGWSIGLYFTEYFSEMWDHPDYPDSESFLEYLDEIYADAVTLGGTGYAFDEIHGFWPLYDDPLDGLWADTDVPMLMLQGELDPATPHSMAISMQEHFTGEHQYFLDFEYGSHGIVFGTPTSYSMFGRDCGVDILRAFLVNPTGDLDSSCEADVVPLTFEGEDGATRYMDRPNWWEN